MVKAFASRRTPFQFLSVLAAASSSMKDSKAKVTWGAESKEFTKEQLASGINLAADAA